MRPGVVTWVKQQDPEIISEPTWHLSTDVGLPSHEGQHKWPTWCGKTLPVDSPILALGEVLPVKKCGDCQTAIARELGFVV